MSNFGLTKWYVDCIGDDGQTFIGYWIELKWGQLKVNGYQLLQRNIDGEIKTQTVLAKVDSPMWDGKGNLNWTLDNFCGYWKSYDSPIQSKLLKSDLGEINWNCVQPKAKVEIKAKKFSFTGWGYSEFIEINIPVWKLSFQELYWGRAISDNHSLVWIKWLGESEQCWLWHNAHPVINPKVSLEEIIGGDVKLKFGEKYNLRQGVLNQTIFKPFINLVKLLPNKTLIADENKWLGFGVMEVDNKMESTTIIYEKVVW